MAACSMANSKWKPRRRRVCWDIWEWRSAATAILYWVLRRFTPSTVPFADGLTVALFLTAQFMMSKKIVQNWWFWIVGDVLVIGLYIYKQLYLTSALYAFFLVMCIAGLLEWQKASRRAAVAAA